MNLALKYTLVAILAFALGYLASSRISNDDIADEPTLQVSSIASSKTDSTIPKAHVDDQPEPTSQDSNHTKFSKSVTLRDFLLGDFKSGGRWIMFDVFDSTGEVTDAFATMYGLSKEEARTLNSAAKKTNDQLFRMVGEHSRITKDSEGTTKVSIAPFEGAEDLYSTILDTFKDTLGDERFSDFLELGERSLREKFHEFGGESLDVSISAHEVQVTSENGNTEIQVRYEVSELSNKDGQTRTRNLNSITEEKLESEFGLIKRLMESEPNP